MSTEISPTSNVRVPLASRWLGPVRFGTHRRASATALGNATPTASASVSAPASTGFKTALAVGISAAAVASMIWGAPAMSSAIRAKPMMGGSATASRPVVASIARDEAEKVFASKAPAILPTVAKVGVGLAPVPSATYATSMEDANAALENLRYGAALSLYQQAASLEPSGSDASVGLARTYLELGQAEQALGTMQRVNHRTAATEFWTAEALAQMGRSQDAIAHYSQVLELQPSGFLAQQAQRGIGFLNPSSP